MVAYSFKPQFRAPILAGTKRQTIRADRKRHARPGEQVQLYTGMRTRQCKLIGTAICEATLPIRIDVEQGVIVVGDGWPIDRGRDLDIYARADGFADWPAMRVFWRQEHFDAPVFSGVVIRWGGLDA